MNGFFNNLTDKLDALEWSSSRDVHNDVRGLLRWLNTERSLFRDELARHTVEQRLRVAYLSHEPSTHFKWRIFQQPTLGYQIWIHEYKDAEFRRPGYATVPHNHRYWFSSLLMSGGFTQTILNPMRALKAEGAFEKLEIVKQVSFSRGSIYTVDSDAVHTISNILDSTITLVIQSPPVKAFSEEYRLSDRKIIRHYPFATRVAERYPFLDKI